MSLSSFLDRRDVRRKFLDEFPTKPALGRKLELQAAPRTKRHSLVGTAFDYLLRFQIQRHDAKAESGEWVARRGLQELASGAESSSTYDIGEDKFSLDCPAIEKAARAFTRARAAHAEFMQTGEVTDRLLRGAIHLAKLDTVYRCGYVDDDMGGADRADVRDLRNLIGLVDPKVFRAERLCLLNPAFEASKMIGGADADVVIDSMLIDIKTTNRFELRRETFNQLIGYMLLYQMGGYLGHGAKPEHDVTRLAVYFARFGVLVSFDVKDIVNPDTFPAFRQWFVDTVRGEYQQKVESRRRAGQARTQRWLARQSALAEQVMHILSGVSRPPPRHIEGSGAFSRSRSTARHPDRWRGWHFVL